MSENKKECACGEECSCKAEENNSDSLIHNLKNDIEKKNKRINELEEQVKSINAEYVIKLSQKMEQANVALQDKIAEINAKTVAEIQNIKKYALEKDAIKLVEIINQFDLALSYSSSDEKIKKYQAGFKMFLTMLKNFLDQINVKEVPIAVGDEFDGVTMECVDTVLVQGMNDNCVAEVVTKCYKLHDRIIQVAVVKVNKNDKN